VTKRRWLVVLALILAALATAALVLYSIPVATDAVGDGVVTSIRQLRGGHNRAVILASEQIPIDRINAVWSGS
jgi:hypothetical protein